MACPDLAEAGTLAEFVPKGKLPHCNNALKYNGFQIYRGLDAAMLLPYDMADSADSLSLSHPRRRVRPGRTYRCGPNARAR